MNKDLLMSFLKERNKSAEQAVGNEAGCNCESSRNGGIRDFTSFLMRLINGGQFDA